MTSNRIRQWRLYVITDKELSGRSHLEVARSAIEGGADVIQLRDKTASARKLYEVGRDLLGIAHQAGVPIVINDRVDIALAIGADGGHLGQEDLPISVARDLLGLDKIIGGSARTLQEPLDAEQLGVDYLGVGPIIEAQTTKLDTGGAHRVELINRNLELLPAPRDRHRRHNSSKRPEWDQGWGGQGRCDLRYCCCIQYPASCYGNETNPPYP